MERDSDDFESLLSTFPSEVLALLAVHAISSSENAQNAKKNFLNLCLLNRYDELFLSPFFFTSSRTYVELFLFIPSITLHIYEFTSHTNPGVGL